jgi:hypothetical protein
MSAQAKPTPTAGVSLTRRGHIWRARSLRRGAAQPTARGAGAGRQSAELLGDRLRLFEGKSRAMTRMGRGVERADAAQLPSWLLARLATGQLGCACALIACDPRMLERARGVHTHEGAWRSSGPLP